MGRKIRITDTQLREIAPGFIEDFHDNAKKYNGKPSRVGSNECGGTLKEDDELSLSATPERGESEGDAVNRVTKNAKDNGLKNFNVVSSVSESKNRKRKPISEGSIKMTWGQLLSKGR